MYTLRLLFCSNPRLQLEFWGTNDNVVNQTLEIVGICIMATNNFCKKIPETNFYTFLSSDYQTLLKGNLKNDETETLITAKELSEITGEKVAWVNVLEWQNSNQFYIKAGQKYRWCICIRLDLLDTFKAFSLSTLNIDFE